MANEAELSLGNVVIIEDEPQLAQLQADYLDHAGFQTSIIGDGQRVLPWLASNRADLIVLDVMLPGVDGLTLCRTIRRNSEIPILMISARGEEADRLLGLELGADDYLSKPFSPREMVARVKTILRRAKPSQTEAAPGLLLDAERLTVSVGKVRIQLTSVEFQLLQVLSRQPGRVFSRAQLMDAIYRDQRVVSDRTIDSHIKKLRKKLSEMLPARELIQSVYGAGYRLECTA
ncbi:response regulator [Methylomonas sp. LWB]|uniref:response regulator n=1 Tax=Methylomonas sp. LWB TaxID=1905845 RepID=UPI0009F5B85F|nr:response regulator [Methylomonas sp. LWB]